MNFVIKGAITPYVHRTYKGKYTDRANAYHASQNAIRNQLKNRMQREGWTIIGRGVPLRLRLRVIRPGIHNVDATNLQKAVEDAAQSVVFENDAWVDDVRTTVERGRENVAYLSVEPLPGAVPGGE